VERRQYNYRGFSQKRLGEPQYAHIRLLLTTWPIYFALYFLTENLIPAEKCHVIHCALDDLIPFCEYFLVFYVGWFFLVAGSLLYYLLRNVMRFRQLDIFIFVTQMTAMAVYILYPNRQDLRPEVFARENVFTWIMGFIYAFDTSTGVCPSLHVAFSLAIFAVMVRDPDISAFKKVLLGIFVICVALATAFVKQHSMVDVFVAIPTALLGEIFVYHTPLGRRLCEQEVLPERYG